MTLAGARANGDAPAKARGRDIQESARHGDSRERTLRARRESTRQAEAAEVKTR